jgi:hypothetical protein
MFVRNLRCFSATDGGVSFMAALRKKINALFSSCAGLPIFQKLLTMVVADTSAYHGEFTGIHSPLMYLLRDIVFYSFFPPEEKDKNSIALRENHADNYWQKLL